MNVISSLTSHGTSSRSFIFSSGSKTVFIPDLCAAITFSFIPPTGRTFPLNEISPVIASVESTGVFVTRDAIVVSSVTPADGPSLGIDPAGTWM